MLSMQMVSEGSWMQSCLYLLSNWLVSRQYWSTVDNFTSSLIGHVLQSSFILQLHTRYYRHTTDAPLFWGSFRNKKKTLQMPESTSIYSYSNWSLPDHQREDAIEDTPLNLQKQQSYRCFYDEKSLALFIDLKTNFHSCC